MPKRSPVPEQVLVAPGDRYPRAVATPRDEVLDRVAGAFQPYSRERITREDAREFTANLGRFFDVLQDWAIEDAARGKGPWVGLVERTNPEAPEDP